MRRKSSQLVTSSWINIILTIIHPSLHKAILKTTHHRSKKIIHKTINSIIRSMSRNSYGPPLNKPMKTMSTSPWSMGSGKAPVHRKSNLIPRSKKINIISSTSNLLVNLIPSKLKSPSSLTILIKEVHY